MKSLDHVSVMRVCLCEMREWVLYIHVTEFGIDGIKLGAKYECFEGPEQYELDTLMACSL